MAEYQCIQVPGRTGRPGLSSVGHVDCTNLATPGTDLLISSRWVGWEYLCTVVGRHLALPHSQHPLIKRQDLAGHWWLTPAILATQDAEIRRIMVWSQSWQVVRETPILKKFNINRAGGVAQGVGPEFKPWYYTQKRGRIFFWSW
jgi:hypothetical protein